MKTTVEQYKEKTTSPWQAMERVKSGDTIVYGMSIAQPPALLGALAERARSGGVRDLKVYTFLPREHATTTVLSPDLCDCIENYSWFVGAADRNSVKVGLNYHVPSYLHQIPQIVSEYMDTDIAMATVSPMDKAGFFSLGTANDYFSTAARHCKRLFVEVNRNMPRVFGDSLIHISEVDAVVENHVPLMELRIADAKPEDDIIGPAIAAMVPDGATIQLGIGNLPNAVARYLKDHKDIGIHTEMLTEGMVNLIEAGVANGRRKNLHPRKHVYTTAAGTKQMYEFMNDNPSMESYAASYVCLPSVIAQNENMISINSVLEVDLLGQANAEYLEGATFSGTGGQLDFVRGAFASRGGKSFLAFYSTAKSGTISRVVPRLASGSVVTTPRADTHYLATEHGIVNLKGKSTRERALAIISLAHPKFRDELMRQAEDMYLI
ncbi:MAG: acetyl-CoA hydrolase/transferase C-terminal domain-containing protein [Methanoregula sp.]|nr:acetyl-CoA hydrolase/transferase C-terminal domain-containing protein [Methanoregula sp.]